MKNNNAETGLLWLYKALVSIYKRKIHTLFNHKATILICTIIKSPDDFDIFHVLGYA